MWFSLSFWRRRKGAYRDGLVDKDTTWRCREKRAVNERYCGVKG
jgi:hypothetical protein